MIGFNKAAMSAFGGVWGGCEVAPGSHLSNCPTPCYTFN
jgi:hypothetical protein